MEPYNPNKPFIQMKLDGSLLDRMVEAGIPFTTALKYFHENPEGPASETLNLATDETVPFKWQLRTGNATPASLAEEAIMLAMPGHTRTKQGRLEVDKKRTSEINKKFEELAKQDPNSLIRLYTDNKPMSFDNYETLRYINKYADTYPLKAELADLFNVWDDVIVSDTRSGSPKYSKVKEPFPTHTYSRNTWADDKPKLPHQDPEYIADRYQPERLATSYDDRGVNNYNFTAGELDSYDKPTIRDLYRKDYPYNPYGNSGQYDYSLRNKGISGEAYNKLMELGREYERTVMDETIPYQDKLRKLSEIKNEMEVLETLENLE